MRFSILHISDLHRDLSDEIENVSLLESLRNDFDQFEKQIPAIQAPSLAIVTGDLVYGVSPGRVDAEKELQRQYEQAKEFLVGLADQFFGGRRDRIVILPGNHDVCYNDVMASSKRLAIPSKASERAQLVNQLFSARGPIRNLV